MSRRRFVQIKNQAGEYELWEYEKSAPKERIWIHGCDPTYQSPIDGREIIGKRSLREHNKEHNVVHAAEFGSDVVGAASRIKARDQAEYDREFKKDFREAADIVYGGYEPHVEKIDHDDRIIP